MKADDGLVMLSSGEFRWSFECTCLVRPGYVRKGLAGYFTDQIRNGKPPATAKTARVTGGGRYWTGA